MKYFAYVIKDKVSEEFNVPFYQKNDACAKRAFTETINRDIRPMKNLKVEDFELYCIGDYDTSTGIFNNATERNPICCGADVEVYEYDEPAAVPFTPQQMQEAFSKQMSALTAQNPTKPKKRWFGGKK